MALLRHSGIYFLARILAGAAGSALIAAYTRLLSAQEFGELALSMAGVVIFSVLIVEGSMLAMLRSLPEHPAAARATALWGLILPAAALCCVAATIFLLAAPERWRLLLALCAGLLLASLLHQFQLASAQGTLGRGRYAFLGGFESLLDMTLGISLVWLGYGVAGALLGTMLAALITVALNVILIPHYGAVGAAAAALIGFGAGFVIAVIKMRGVFPFPLPDPAILSSGLIGAAAMAAWLWPFHHVTAWSAALYVIPVAIVVYFGAVFLFLHFTGRKPLELLRGLWQSETNINAKRKPAFEGR